ncbi:MAG TPA: glycosyltransferase [Rhizomicrobium sp.]|nr:glycosyltransferase [Rhizomicrobium sp.]
MLVSVIVPTFNGRDTIARCLDALMHQDWDGAMEIIVVDDGSSDGTMDVVRAFPGVISLCQRNAGPAAARNRGVRAARGEVLVFTDDDCRPLPDFVRRLVGPLRENAAIVGAKGTYLSQQPGLVARFRQIEYEERYCIMQRHRHIDFIDTYAAAFRKDAFNQVGGFDESMLASEDVDLSFRLAAQGARMVFVPDARVSHRHCETLRDYIRVKTRGAFWRLKMTPRMPQKALKDTHTPSLMKLQLLVLPMLLVAGLSLLLSPALALAVLLIGLGLFLASCIPFVIFAAARDPFVALMAPALLLVRSIAQCSGLVSGLMSFREAPRSPATPLSWYRNRAN